MYTSAFVEKRVEGSTVRVWLWVILGGIFLSILNLLQHTIFFSVKKKLYITVDFSFFKLYHMGECVENEALM